MESDVTTSVAEAPAGEPAGSTVANTDSPGGAPKETQPVAETTGVTVDAAVTTAIAELSIDAVEAEVEIITEGVRPLPGERIAAAEAKVRVRLLPERARRARRLLEELLQRMEIPARVTARRVAGGEGNGPIVLEINGDDLGLLIGWRGENLRALQTVVNLMAGDEEEGGRRIILDVERYRARREDQVRDLALRIAHRVKRTGQPYSLEPMQAYERRIVHITLEDDEGVRTESVGMDPARRLTVHPTGPAQGGFDGPTFHGIPRGPRPGGGAGSRSGGGYRPTGGGFRGGDRRGSL